MTNVSAALAKSREEQAFYDSRPAKGSYTQRKNRAILRRVAEREPTLLQTLANLVAATTRFTRQDWIAVWTQSGWEESPSFPYPPTPAYAAAPPVPVVPPPPRYPAQNAHPIFSLVRPPGPAPAPRARPSPPQPIAGPSRSSAIANLAFHPYDRNQAGPSRPSAAATQAQQSPRYPPVFGASSYSTPKALHATPSQKTSGFRTKLDTFYRHPALQRDEEGRCTLVVSRDNLLQSGYNEVMAKAPSDLKKLMIIRFHGEEGDDAGGLSKEFFFLLSKELFNPEYGLFETGSEYQTVINAMSGLIDPEHHLQHFKLFGRTVALSIFHHRLIDVRFAPTFYKAMLGQTPTLADLKDVDKSLYQSLVWTLGNSVSGVLDEQTFSYEEDRFGETIVVELVKHGAMIQVTEENKREYVNALVESKIAGRTKEQFDSFMAGFDEIFPRALLKVFTPAELEALISGNSELDVVDWKKYTELENYTIHDPQIRWFWQVVEGMDASMKSKLLQFATGAARIPLTGFRDLSGGGESRLFKITRVGTKFALPQAHSCFNRLDLPPYESMAVLKEKLTMAILESDGFEQA